MKASKIPRRVFLTLVGAALAVGSLSACGSDSDNESGASTEDASSTLDVDPSDSSGSSEGLPEGFPEDIPLPEGAELKSSQDMGEGSWRLRYQTDLDDDNEARMDRYSQRLIDAGFDVTHPSGVNVSATNDGYRVDAVIRAPTITLQVITLG